MAVLLGVTLAAYSTSSNHTQILPRTTNSVDDFRTFEVPPTHQHRTHPARETQELRRWLCSSSLSWNRACLAPCHLPNGPSCSKHEHSWHIILFPRPLSRIDETKSKDRRQHGTVVGKMHSMPSYLPEACINKLSTLLRTCSMSPSCPLQQDAWRNPCSPS